MLQYLENLRKKPEAQRRKAVFLLSLYITLVIAIVWAILTSIRVSQTNFSFDTSGIDNKVPTIGDTFNKFIDRLGQVIETKPASTYEATRTP